MTLFTAKMNGFDKLLKTWKKLETKQKFFGSVDFLEIRSEQTDYEYKADQGTYYQLKRINHRSYVWVAQNKKAEVSEGLLNKAQHLCSS